MAGQTPAAQRVQAKLLADVSAIQAGAAFRVGVLLTIEPGWHVYWKNPGDAGLATSVTWSLPAGWEAGEVEFPVPRRFEQPGGIAGYGYEGTLLLMARLKPPEDLKAGSAVRIGAEVSWLACQEVCVPGSAKLALTVPTGEGDSGAERALFREWEKRLPGKVPTGTRVDVMGSAETGFELKVRWGADVSAVEWFPAADESILVRDVSVRTEGRQTHIRFGVQRLSAKKKGEGKLGSVVAYTDSTGRRRGFEVTVPLEAAPRP